MTGGGIVVLFFAMSVLAHAQKSEHEFIGSKKCSLCHKSEKQGSQYPIWQKSNHAKAFETLATPEAKEVASHLGIDDPQKSGECLRCHATAYWFGKEKVTDTIAVEEGIGCESCHGPGKDYMKMSTMKDQQKAIEAGLLLANEETCRKCHNETAPNVKEFIYKESWEKIKHPIPKK